MYHWESALLSVTTTDKNYCTTQSFIYSMSCWICLLLLTLSCQSNCIAGGFPPVWIPSQGQILQVLSRDVRNFKIDYWESCLSEHSWMEKNVSMQFQDMFLKDGIFFILNTLKKNAKCVVSGCSCGASKETKTKLFWEEFTIQWLHKLQIKTLPVWLCCSLWTAAT